MPSAVRDAIDRRRAFPWAMRLGCALAIGTLLGCGHAGAGAAPVPAKVETSANVETSAASAPIVAVTPNQPQPSPTQLGFSDDDLGRYLHERLTPVQRVRADVSEATSPIAGRPTRSDRGEVDPPADRLELALISVTGPRRARLPVESPLLMAETVTPIDLALPPPAATRLPEVPRISRPNLGLASVVVPNTLQPWVDKPAPPTDAVRHDVETWLLSGEVIVQSAPAPFLGPSLPEPFERRAEVAYPGPTSSGWPEARYVRPPLPPLREEGTPSSR